MRTAGSVREADRCDIALASITGGIWHESQIFTRAGARRQAIAAAIVLKGAASMAAVAAMRPPACSAR